jgi:hypothetical protein
VLLNKREVLKMEALKKLFNNHTMLIVCGIASIVLLFIFILLQGGKPNLLSLESRWLIVSGIPLLYALIVGGYIKSFKGFGLELESQLKNPVKYSSLLVSDVIDDMPGSPKKSKNSLKNISIKTRKKIERLTFNCGKKGYYVESVIKDYLIALPNIKYFEFVLKNGQFFCLLPISIFKKSREIIDNNFNDQLEDRYDEQVNEQFYSSAIIDLIDAINNDELLTFFGVEAITAKVIETQSVIDILPIVRSSKHGVVGVINENERLVGIIDKHTLESKIADEVLLAGRKN